MVRERMKRTYNLSPAIIATVRRLVEEEHLAPSQDVLVEQAIAHLERLVRDTRDAQLWSQAAQDREFCDECRQLDQDLPPIDLSKWPHSGSLGIRLSCARCGREKPGISRS